jgi:hypothetical protein
MGQLLSSAMFEIGTANVAYFVASVISSQAVNDADKH